MQNKLLEDCTNENTKLFSFNTMVKKTKVVSVYDGDTVTLAINMIDDYYKFKCRLMFIDTAERRNSNEQEKIAALKARDWLSNLVLNKILYVRCYKWDKYGRLLGVLYENKDDAFENKKENSINYKIVENNHGYFYHGGKRKSYSEWS